MGERLFFSKLVTKDLTALDSNRRLFEGVLTVEMKDRQGEITIRDELMKVLPIWIARGGPITDTHSNRVVGQGINFQQTTVTDENGHSYPAITIQGEIFKDYELDNEIWDAIKSGKYKGLSFGGATKSSRTPVMQKDGSLAYSLKDLEQYEVAVCEEPAVPLALITAHNQIAKAMAGKTVDRGNGQMCIRCDKFKCYVDKDSLVKIEDDEDDDTQITVLDEWKNETHPDKNGKTEGIRTTKNGEPFADVTDANIPTKDEKAEALEADRSQGSNQDNGATYHGTSKARHSLDDGVYARKEEVGVDMEPGTDKLKDAQDGQSTGDGLPMRAKPSYGVAGKPLHTPKEGQFDSHVISETRDSASTQARLRDQGKKEKPSDDLPKIGTVTHLKDEKAMDKDDKEMLEEAGLEEEKKLEYANDESEGPVRKIAPLAGAGAVLAGGAAAVGGAADTALGAFDDSDDSDESTCKSDSDNPGAPKYTRTNEAGDKTDQYGNKIPGVMSKKPKQDTEKPVGRMTSDVKVRPDQTVAESREERGEKGPGMSAQSLAQRQSRLGAKKVPKHNAPYGIPAVRHGDPKKALDILTATFAIKAGVDIKTGVPKPKVGLMTEAVPESESLGRVNPKKEQMEHGSTTDAAHYNHQATSYDPEMAEKWKTGGCYNTCEVVREYTDEDKKEMKKMEPHFVDEKGDVWYAYKARTFSDKPNAMKYPTPGESTWDTKQQKRVKETESTPEKITNELPSPKPGDKTGTSLKTNTDGVTWTEPARGGFAGREEGETCDRNESTSIHDVTQPKHVNRPTDEKGAKGLKKLHEKKPEDDTDGVLREVNNYVRDKLDETQYKKERAAKRKAAGDPQLQGNNSEDGVNRKIRLDNDPEAEAFAKSAPVDGGNAGSGGVRSGAAYDNAQQDTGQKDAPRKVEERDEYTGVLDTSSGASNDRFSKSTIIINTLNMELKKRFI